MNKKEKNIDSDSENLSKGNIIIPDTNVLIQDPASVDEFLKGDNLLVITWKVFLELDSLKKKSDVGWEAQKAIKRIHALYSSGANIVIESRTQFSGNNLDRKIPDHCILATVIAILKSRKNKVKNPYHGYSKVKLITNDYGMQIAAMKEVNDPDFSIEFYKKDITKLKKDAFKLLNKNILGPDIKKDKDGKEYYQLEETDDIPYGVPVVVYSNCHDNWKAYCVAVRKDNRLVFLDSDITASKIKAKTNGGPNWQQVAALNFLMDDSIDAVFLQGGAGTGKTLLALATGLAQKRQKKYKQLIVMRPTIYLSDDDDLGFIPGDLNQKMAPWLLSIKQNLAVISPSLKNSRKKGEEEMSDLEFFAKQGLEIQPLGHIRGSSFEDCFIIIEEAQNLSRHMIKTILTRPSKGTKMVFTGDLGQIDNKRLNKETSGLTHAIARLRNNPLVAIVNFEQTLRSKLASLADKNL